MLQAITPSTDSYTRIVPAKAFRMARSMLRMGSTMDTVLVELGGRYTEAQLAEAHSIEQARRAVRHRFKRSHPASAVSLPFKLIPDAVQRDRDHRASLVPRDTTALRMGDPLPGYSALERAPSIASAEITSDPLDTLIFRKRKVVQHP